ncbi:cytochrome P460 family protein [Acidithiobacillus sp. IBUN Pt1247-S3]
MIKFAALSLAFSIAVAGLGTAWASSTDIPSPQALWQQIQVLQKEHAIMPESRTFQAGSRIVDVHTTDLASAAAIQSIKKAGGIVKVSKYENGSLLVKENYNQEKKLTGVTAMLKAKGYDASDRNWVMAAYKPDGTVAAFGKIGSCIACHVMVSKQDFVFAPPPQQLLSVKTWKAFFPKQEMNPVYVTMIKTHPKAVVN